MNSTNNIFVDLQASQEVKKDLQKAVSDALAEGKSAKEITNEVKDFTQKNNLVEHEVIVIVRELSGCIFSSYVREGVGSCTEITEFIFCFYL